MATNQITINFSPCSPAISYRVFYREIGDVSFIEWPDEFTSSPIVFEVEGPDGQLYEGLLVSVCEGDVTGPEVPWTGEPPISGEPGCCDPDVIDAVAETIIPDGSGSSSAGGNFLRLVYNVNMSGESVSDWNAFFGNTSFTSVVYSAGGTVVDLYGSGTFNFGAGFSGLFTNNMTIIRVLDFADVVTEITGHTFTGAENFIEIDCPACTVVDSGAFFGCSSLTDVSLPLLTAISDQLFVGTTVLANLTLGDIITVGIDSFVGCGIPNLNFPDCTSAGLGAFRGMLNIGSLSLPSCTSVGEFCFEDMPNIAIVSLPVCTSVGQGAFRANGPSLSNINLSSCSDLGGTTGNDNVFEFVVGNTITLTLLTATATDTDVTILQANNSVTLILV